MRLTPDTTLRVLADGRTLIGGTPPRAVRLSPGGARLVGRWLAGEPVTAPAHLALARRLVAAGLAHPRHGAGRYRPEDVTAVVPVRDRPDGLRELRSSLGELDHVLVVDDGSAVPVADAVARHPSPRGPAAARNTGARSVTTQVVAFLDSDVVPRPGWLRSLLPHFEDPEVAAVAPRVRSRPGPTARERYEAARSPLDLGPEPAEVRPGGRVGHLPTAALLVRTSVLRALDGFDESLRYGEDVDLVWRLLEAGHRVRYEPAAEVLHRPRADWPALLRQRFDYGGSAAPLSRRHGDAVAPARLSPWTAAAWTAALTGHPRTALAVATTTAALLPRTLAPAGVPAPEALRLALRGQLGAARMLGQAALRTWWPVALPALAAARPGRTALAALLVSRLRGRPGDVHPLLWCAAGLADDLAYGAGVWHGALRERTALPLLPALTGPARGNHRPP
ncbi:mycofactocin biosynthesis glycosyltransferase MftF [Streptomyces sp. NPDC005017]|uniref:mycofactocin biosynthesis glycosyltransferase MftF n=1 Tax=Streptomyces sp. NPDC005017 TaxID=3364706 RepID=UPI0036C58E24